MEFQKQNLKCGVPLKRDRNGGKNYIIISTIVGLVSTTPTGIKQLILLSVEPHLLTWN